MRGFEQLKATEIVELDFLKSLQFSIRKSERYILN